LAEEQLTSLEKPDKDGLVPRMRVAETKERVVGLRQDLVIRRGSKSFAPAGVTKEGLEQMPLGVAIWAKLSEAAEAKLEKGERLTMEEWRSGDRVWLVELISPFGAKDNKITEAMLFDLMQGPFRDTSFNLHRTDPATGRRDKIHMKSHVGKMPEKASWAALLRIVLPAG
jgi:hypothetical protein